MSYNEYEHVSDSTNVEPTGIVKLSRDLRAATATMTQDEARYLVDYYYQLQDDRIRAKGRHRAFSVDKEPHELIVWLSDNTAFLEKQIAKGLLAYAQSDFVGQWSLSVTGIGGVLSAGLLAHIDIEKCPAVGHIYSFAGIAPNGKKWEKGGKRPFNAKLKVLTWKIGESFVKVSGRPQDYYGKVYVNAKAELTASNEAGAFEGEAARILTEKKFGKETEAFKAYLIGKLPLAHVHARAKRKAVYLFLSHWWEVAYKHKFPGRPCPQPYAIAHGGHVHYIPVFNDPFQLNELILRVMNELSIEILQPMNELMDTILFCWNELPPVILYERNELKVFDFKKGERVKADDFTAKERVRTLDFIC